MMFHKTAVLRGNRQKMPEICRDTVGDRPRGSPGFLLAGDLMENVVIGSSILFGHFPKCILYSVSIAENVSNTVWAFPKESPILFSL
jgi:hypothetical protein